MKLTKLLKTTYKMTRLFSSGVRTGEIGSENGSFTKMGDLKTDPSQKSRLKNGAFTKMGDLKTDPSQKSATLKRSLHINERP